MELCEACFKALEAAPSELSGCERNYDAKFGFSAPVWTVLDPLKHLTLLKQLMMFIIPPDPSRGIEGTIYDGDNFKRKIEQLMEYERIEISLTMVDIDNDDQLEPVVKFRQEWCNPQNRSAFQPLIVLSSDRTAINRTKTDVVTQNERKRPERPAGGVYSQIYDVFQYKGRFYFDRWDNDVLEPGTFSVYQAIGNKVSKLCKYSYEHRYRSQVPGGKP